MSSRDRARFSSAARTAVPTTGLARTGGAMPTVLFVVKATIASSREEAFNRWYDETHVPDVLKFPGVVSARRYRALEGEDTYQYMAVYEVRDEKT
jgi:hypothetical protein